MQKLIKLSDTHYIVVEDSEIKPTEWFYNGEHVLRCSIVTDIIIDADGLRSNFDTAKKITHSTQSLESIYNAEAHEIENGTFRKIKPLSLSEVEEAIYGYSVEKMANQKWGNVHRAGVLGYTEGFNAHKELVKDKLFTEHDMLRAIEMARLIFDGKETFECEDIAGVAETDTYGWKNKYSDEQIIQSLLPKTEWNIKIIK